MSVARETVRLELPFPPKGLSPNSRLHWAKRAKVVAAYRETCCWTAFEHWQLARKPLTPPVVARVTFVVPTRHKRDTDNLLAMLKPAWDGLVDAGVLSGDDSERFSVEAAEVVVGEWQFDKRPYRRESKVIVELVARGGRA